MTPTPELTALSRRFQVRGTLGRGGMGTVYRAFDPDAQREVALKVLLGAGEVSEERFRREGEVAARLSHPGIVRVYSSGVSAGKPWLAYELVEGARSLQQAMRGLELRAQVELLRQTAVALGYAHAQGVVHRDVKPENVLVDAAGRPRVTDFGLAVGSGDQRLTKTGVMVGTPAYMAPEQFAGGRDLDLGPATDVWALGVILYEVLTGRPPFEAGNLLELAAKVSEGVRALPRALAPEVPAPLEAICVTALRPEPAQRYPHAAAFASDLEDWLAGRRPSSAVAAPARRSRSAGLLALCLVALVVSGLALGLALAPSPAPAARVTPSPSARTSPSAPPATLLPVDQPRALRVQARGSTAEAQRARQQLDRLARAPLRVLNHSEPGRIAYVGVLLPSQDEALTIDATGALRWGMGGERPLEELRPTTSLTVSIGRRSFLGGAPGHLLELRGSALASARSYPVSPRAIGRVGGDPAGKWLVFSEGPSAVLTRFDGERFAREREFDLPGEVTGIAVFGEGSRVVVVGGRRVDREGSTALGFMTCLQLPRGGAAWGHEVPPRPEAAAIAHGELLVGNTMGQIRRYEPLSGRELGVLTSPAESTTRRDEMPFRRDSAHGSTLRVILPLSRPREVLTLSGGPTGGSDVTEVRYWNLDTGEHYGRLEVRGVGGVSLAVDEERGIFYMGTRQGVVHVWSMEAVRGLRTYNASGHVGTGRRARGS